MQLPGSTAEPVAVVREIAPAAPAPAAAPAPPAANPRRITFKSAANVVKQVVRRDHRQIFGIRMRAELNAIEDITEDVHFILEIVMHRSHLPTDYPFKESLAGPPFISLRDGNEKRPTTPKFEFLDARSVSLQELKVLQSTKSGAYFFCFNYDVVLHQPLLLHSYPFDRQCVRVQLQSHAVKINKWTHAMDDSPSNITNDVDWTKSEFTVAYKKLDWAINWIKVINVRVETSDLFELDIGISRNPNHYLLNFVVVIYAVVQTNGSVYAISRLDYANRIATTTTLLLTLVAFKIVLSENVPKIPYQTYLDIYNVVAILFLACWVIENFYVSFRIYPDDPDDEAENVDFYFAMIWNGLWVAFHLLIAVGSRTGLFQNSWEAVEDKEKLMEIEHKTFFANLDSRPVYNLSATNFQKGTSLRHIQIPKEEPSTPTSVSNNPMYSP